MRSKFPKRVVVWMNLQGGLKIGLSALVAMMMVYLFTYQLPAAKTWTYWTMPLSGKVIVLDAGHGGPDGGAKSKAGLVEKEVTLAITMFLRDYLQEAGAVVKLTRETDTDLAEAGTKGYSRRKTEDLNKRAERIANERGDLMISIHLNSIPSDQWRGAQTFYNPSSHPDNKQLAAWIQQEMKRNLENTDRVAKTDNKVFLLKEATMPSALVEVGFLSNSEEARLLGQKSYQQKLAASIYQGILKYSTGEKIGTPQ
ncbi:germination-specific N-acetylmuramoyl-L-alanine amidase [Paenibacillus sp. J31TS4]|uniref:N-acetylmuramoyl-L-alanine amidase CwlD n=1 Tax=Paenibacillus sp. J31TS4 TaxID=2807195 RepID=UPI001B2A0167|nr:N-acetylmuramoyl-L-alanine amidase CwlD [Paenibacillus sp. J31TS4]GIP41463.1 germination-specific N-acetylmuramoyl-L-alanine amidase [Paenibacillus sp. J31TS4]